jgi:hypothetical protein
VKEKRYPAVSADDLQLERAEAARRSAKASRRMSSFSLVVSVLLDALFLFFSCGS